VTEKEGEEREKEKKEKEKKEKEKKEKEKREKEKKEKFIDVGNKIEQNWSKKILYCLLPWYSVNFCRMLYKAVISCYFNTI